MALFDTHAHLDDDQFSDLDQVLTVAREANVQDIVAIGTTAASSQACLKIANQHAGIHAAVGIQPNYVGEVNDGDWEQIEKLAAEGGVVAIGETGLDHYWDYADLDSQRDFFRRHIKLAAKHSYPLVIHMRDPKPEQGLEPSRACAEDIYDVLFESGDRPVKGIMHSYTGDSEMAERFLALGLHISFAGMVTFKKSNELRAVAKWIPDDRILIETDAPYLSPHPCRGTRPNQPALIVHTAKCLADVREIGLKEFEQQTSANAKQLFGL